MSNEVVQEIQDKIKSFKKFKQSEKDRRGDNQYQDIDINKDMLEKFKS